MSSEEEREIDIDELERDDDFDIYYHEGQLFTGVAIERWPNGALRARSEFENGWEVGTDREWYESGQLKYKARMGVDVHDGTIEEWYENGRRKLVSEYDRGQLIRQKIWDETGVLIEDFDRTK